MNTRKVAFTGSSGAGKTTLVKFVEEKFNLNHISGSSGDILTEEDKLELMKDYGYNGGHGHSGVIVESAKNPEYGIQNQWIIQHRRAEVIRNNVDFVTDRSPIDNITYFVNQCGFHPQVTDQEVEKFFKACARAWVGLSHVIYIKAVQPNEVENNGSRVANRYYQRTIDAQFEYWLNNHFLNKYPDGPEVLIIDFWDLEKRKEAVLNFLK